MNSPKTPPTPAQKQTLLKLARMRPPSRKEMAMHKLMTFNFDRTSVRTVKDDQGEPWFVAADLLGILGLDRKALEWVDDDEKGVTSTDNRSLRFAVRRINEDEYRVWRVA